MKSASAVFLFFHGRRLQNLKLLLFSLETSCKRDLLFINISNPLDWLHLFHQILFVFIPPLFLNFLFSTLSLWLHSSHDYLVFLHALALFFKSPPDLYIFGFSFDMKILSDVCLPFFALYLWLFWVWILLSSVYCLFSTSIKTFLSHFYLNWTYFVTFL